MYEIFTIGGGEYIVNTFNAIASWTGSGGWRGMIRVMMVLGLIYALIVMAFSLNWRALLNWFLAATLLYGVMIVPTVTVKVTDRINPSLAPATISNVPIGLATIASFSSKISDYLTNRAETVFTMPAALKMNNNGFIYGARLYDKTREFKFRDPRVNYNVAQYFKQCVFYDIMLGFKNIDTLANSKNLLNDIGPGSPSRGLIYWSNDDSRDFATCEQVYNRLNGSAIPNATDEELSERAKAIYPNKNSTVAHNSLKNHLGVITGQMHGGSQSAEVIFQQRALTQAFLEARANLSEADGDTFATLRAEAQARNTYSSIAQQAMTWVPLLNIVLTVVFYAMFPVIFPLFLLPSTGVQAVKGYVTGFFYLAAWGPLYVILHMFVMDRYSDSLNAIAPGGMTMATMEAIDNVNVDTATIAGFLMMSIPFIAGGMAKGAMAISSQATSMLAPAQSAAEAAAVERTTGNYSYGNLSYQNLTGNMRQSDQWNTAPNYMGGFGQSTFVSADGTTRKTTADGSNVYRIDGGMSQLPFRANVTQNSVEERNKALTESQANIQTTMNETAEVVSALQRRGYEMSTGSRNSYGNDSTSGFRNAANTNHALREGGGVSFSTNDGRDISQSIGKDKSKQEQYTSFDLASGSLSVGANTGSNGVASGSSKGKGGKKGASGLNTGAGPNVSYGYDTREGVLYQTGFSENISDKSSFSANSGTNSFSDKTTNLVTDNGTFNQASSFSRNENYNDSRYTDLQLFDRLQSLTNRLTEQQQTSETLSNIFSSRESGGEEMSHDMSQIIAERYYDYANNDDYRDLNAPSLTATNVLPGELKARDFIANNIIKDYIDEVMQPMRDNNPQFELSPLELDKPSEFTEGDLAASVPHQPTSQNSPSGNSKIESMEDKIKDGIASGSQDIQDAHQRAGHKREQKIIGASTLGQEAEKAYNKKWFYDKK